MGWRPSGAIAKRLELQKLDKLVHEKIPSGRKIRKALYRFTEQLDLDAMILCKGAVSTQAGEKAIIHMNMRDGCLICRGKGNEDWNYPTTVLETSRDYHAGTYRSVKISALERGNAGVVFVGMEFKKK